MSLLFKNPEALIEQFKAQFEIVLWKEAYKEAPYEWDRQIQEADDYFDELWESDLR